jgi:DNA modification methylase
MDPFAGTGTTVAVANTLGRFGVGVDLSADYLKLARWRCQDPGLRAKVLRVDKPAAEVPGQESLFA